MPDPILCCICKRELNCDETHSLYDGEPVCLDCEYDIVDWGGEVDEPDDAA